MKLKLKVHPNSSKQEIIKTSEEEYEVYLKEKPDKNKANIGLVKLLKKYLNKEVKIIHGLKSRIKYIEVK
ncbi:MAG: DUF167 domain-containing protein [Candidatus Pacearchaeota archaeon]